jgi:hypothetical protein
METMRHEEEKGVAVKRRGLRWKEEQEFVMHMYMLQL